MSWLAVAVLAAVVVTLVVFAFARSGSSTAPSDEIAQLPPESSPSSPGPSEAPTESSHPSTSTASPVVERPAPRVLAYFDDLLNGVRVQDGACGGPPATIETSADGGVTWTGSDLGAIGLNDVISISLSGEFQVDIVGTLGPACSVGMVTSYTGGQFWVDRSNALQEGLYFDTGADVVRGPNLTVATPCSSPRVIRSVDSDSTLVCDDGVFAITDERTIGVIQRAGVLDGEIVGDQTAVAIDEPGSCAGVSIVTSDNLTSAVLGESCLDVNADSGVSIAVNGELVRVWAGSVVYESEDRGTSWSQL